jgi:hypothetical protein
MINHDRTKSNSSDRAAQDFIPKKGIFARRGKTGRPSLSNNGFSLEYTEPTNRGHNIKKSEQWLFLLIVCSAPNFFNYIKNKRLGH